MRFISRTLSLIFLAVAIIAAVVDALESVGSETLKLTPLGETWAGFHPDSLNALEITLLENVHPLLWDPIMEWILVQPTIAIFLAFSFLFYVLGYKRKRPEDRFLVR